MLLSDFCGKPDPSISCGAVAGSMSCSSVSSEEDFSFLFANSPAGCGSQVVSNKTCDADAELLKLKQQDLHQGQSRTQPSVEDSHVLVYRLS